MISVLTMTDADVKTIGGFGLQVSSLIDGSPDVLKIKMSDVSEELIDFLEHYSGPVVLDGFLDQQFNQEVFDLYKIAHRIDALLLDALGVEFILAKSVGTQQSIEKAAQELLAIGIKSVLIKAPPMPDVMWEHYYWSNGILGFWLTQSRKLAVNHTDTGTVLSAATASALALGYSPEDSIIIATMYAHQATRLGQERLYYGGFPESEADLPYLSSMPLYEAPQTFKPCHYLGLYPVVDSVEWVETLLQLGVKTIQLRIKEQTTSLEEDMKRCIDLAKKYQATLFINDYWELALKHGAEAIHLGQSDLDSADLEAIRRQGLLLGVSTYCYYEVARAHAICPSYIAIGPIYPTSSKEVAFPAQGIAGLQRWKRTLSYPLIAIGGINFERAVDVVASGVSGVALISAITEADDPRAATQAFLNLMK